jgi:uncharacterized protein
MPSANGYEEGYFPMLLEFTVNNYVCFSNDVTFSFEAMEGMLEAHVFNAESKRPLIHSGKPILDAEGKPFVISTVSAMYGKNASGKSSFLNAMKRLRSLIISSRRIDEDSDFNIDYYDEERPCMFEVVFLANTKEGALPERFRYRIELQGSKEAAHILFEELRNETTNIICYIRKKQEIVNENGFFDSAQFEVLENDLQPKHLILSQPFSMFKELRLPFTQEYWDVQSDAVMPPLPFFIRASRTRHVFRLGFPSNVLLKLEEQKNHILQELQKADMSIVNFELKNQDDDDELIFTHCDGKERDLSQQSDGTRKYFFLMLDVLLVLEKGGLYIADELEKNLHPLLTTRLIEMFKSPKTNPNNARLLFTTHDINLMHQSILDGDQIWLMNRDETTGEGELHTLADVVGFDPMSSQSDYIMGAYGAIPDLKKGV